MADVQSNIKVSIDTTDALASIKNLQRQISAFHTSMAKGGAAANAVTSQLQQNLINSVNATGKFSAQMRTIKTTTESFTSSLEKNKFSMGEYFRYAGGASKTFGRLFKTEFETINKVARENVKDLQTQYIKMGRDANGAMKAIAVRPLSLDMNNLATKTMVAAQKQAILNQLLKQGSTNLLNFGKNTQWAGRQLMVGFTIPLMALGAAASKTFMDMETQAIRFKKVYGDLFTSTTESTAALDAIKNLGKEFTKYGIAVSDTVGLASEAAAAGFKGVDLQRQTAAATRLSILGQVESQKALETTIALQNAFAMSSEDLAKNIDFLNAVENQTVLSLDDMSTAIPKAAPVIQQLGGDVKDLAFFMAAMKEGGINASEGANALKSGLASMINPTAKASAMLQGFGINIKKIVVDNKGDLKKTVTDFATALNKLDPLNRAQAIEQMFGKFQFARLSTLFANVTKEGTQAARVLDLAGASIQELAALSEKELGQTSESAMNKFRSSIEQLKLALVPVGEQFLKVITPIAEFITKILDKFNSLGDGTKKVIVVLTAVVAGLGPVLLMTFGLLMNGLANIIKGFTFLKSIFNKAGRATGTLGTEVKYMTTEQRNAAAVASSLDQVHRNLAQTFSSEAAAVDGLTRAYYRAVAAQSQFMPIRVPLQRGAVKKRAKGKPARVGGTGNQDTELALLMPGETVIPTKMSKKYASIINGMISDTIPGYEAGRPTTSSTPAYWTAEKRNALLDSLGLTGRERVRIPYAGNTPTYSTSGVMAPASVNDTAAGMTSEFIKSPLGRAAYNENIRVGLEDAGVSAKRISEVFDEVGPTLKDSIDKFDDTSGAWSKTAQEAMDKINRSPNLSQSEKIALRKRIAPLMPEDYTVGSKRVLEVSRRRAVPRAERVNAPAQYGSARMLRRLRLQFPNQDFSGWEYSHMPGQASIPGQQSDVAQPTIGTGVKGVKGRALSAGEIAILAQERKNIEARSSESSDTAGKKDAKAYSDAVEKGTEDIYVKSRKRKSPHSLVPQDGRDDARAYNTAVDKELTRGSKKRRVAYRAQGAPISVIPVSTVDPRVIPFSDGKPPVVPPIIPPVIPPGYTPPEGPMYGPRTPTKYDKTVGKVAGKFRGTDGKIRPRLPSTGMGMSLSSAAMMGSYMMPGKIGNIVQQISMIGFALSALKPVVTGLATALGVAAGTVVAFATLLIGMGVGIYLFNKSAKKAGQEIIDSAKREAEARVGSARAITQFGKTFNKSLPSEREFSRNNRQAIKGSGTLVETFAKDYATKGNISTQIINQAALKGQSQGIDAIALDVANKAAIFGLSPEEIAANIKAASDLIGADQVKVKLAVQKLLSPDGKDILKEPLTIQARMEFLKNQSAPAIKAIGKQINALSEIDYGSRFGIGDPRLLGLGGVKYDYASLKRDAEKQKSINESYAAGGFKGTSMGILKEAATGVEAILGINGESVFSSARTSVVEDFTAIEQKIQGSSTLLSIAFMQQTEALALLNTQYADGLIDKKTYDEQMLVSGTNFDSLQKSSLSLVKQLKKIDPTGKLAAAAVEDLGNQALATLKKSNPALFDQITASMKNLAASSKIKLFFGYQQGSLTLMDLAILPDLITSFTGKTYTASIDLIMGSGLTESAAAWATKFRAEAALASLSATIKPNVIPDISVLNEIAFYKAEIAKANALIAEKRKVDQSGNLNSELEGYQDIENGTDGAMTATERYLDVLEKEIDALKAKRDAQKDANDEVQREIDLKNKLADLEKQSVDAKISGDYIKAAMLSQEANQLKIKYDQETELKKKDAEIARLEARYNAIKDGANLTALEKSRIQPVKQANGGAVKGFNTGGNVRGAGTATSDSIPAYLSNGEYVIKADSVKKYGTQTFDALNAGKFAEGGMIQGFRTGGLNRIVKSGISSVSKLIGSKLSGSKSAVLNTREQWLKNMGDLMSEYFGISNAIKIEQSSNYEKMVFPKILDSSDLRDLGDPRVRSLNIVRTMEDLKTGNTGYLKTLQEVTPDEVRREVFGSLFARRAGLLAPENLPVTTGFQAPHQLGVFSRSLQEMSPGSISEMRLSEKLKLPQSKAQDDRNNVLSAKIYASLGMTSERSYRNAILDSMGFVDNHGGNLYINPIQKQAGAIDFGRIGDSGYSITQFADSGSLNELKNKYYRQYVELPESERAAYLEGLTKAKATLSGIKKSEIEEMLLASGYNKSDMPLSIYKNYIDNVIKALQDRLSSKPIQGWDEILPKLPIDENWYKTTDIITTSDAAGGYINNTNLNITKGLRDKISKLGIPQYANGGAVQGFRTGGLNKMLSGAVKKMAFSIPNKINQIKNYLKVRSLIKDGMYHGSQPTGLRGEEYLQGKNILEGAETYDPHYGMGFFGTSSKSEAEMYASGYNSPNNWSESFGSMNKITKAPFGKYVDFTRGTNSIKWQNYKLYQALGMEKDGYLGNYLTENLGDIMAGQNITGSIMNRINDGMVPGDMASAKWLAWAKPKGVHTEEYMGSFAPKKPASLLDNLKSKFSLLNKPKGYNTGGHILGAGTATSDSIPAMLSDGEYVIRASSVKKYGTETFDALNAQRFSEGSPGGVSPISELGKLSKKKMFGMGAKSGMSWQAMEELEKALSLRWGANKNASGFSKWSRALGRVAFNALQGGFSGAYTSPNPFGALVGTAFGLGEGIVGLAQSGSDYGVKGGTYSNVKGFNPKAQLDSMNVMDSAFNVGLSGLMSGVLGVGFGKLGEKLGPLLKPKAIELANKIPEPIRNKATLKFNALRPKIEELSQPFSNPFKRKPTAKPVVDPVAKTPSLIKSAAKRAAQQTPTFGQELLQSGFWNTLGKIKGVNTSKLRKKIPKPSTMFQGKLGYDYSYTTGRSYYDEMINTQYRRDKFAEEPDPDDFLSFMGVSNKFYYGSQAYGELLGLIAKSANDKILKPLVTNPIKRGTGLIKGEYQHSKNLVSNTINNLSKENLDDFIYRYTPVGSIKALRAAKNINAVAGEGDMAWSRSVSEIPEKYDPSLRDLFTMPTFHGGALPDTLLNRLTPGKIKQTGSIFNFDLFTTVDKTKALEYATGKNTTADAVALQQTIWNKPKSLSKIWDMRGGRKSLWSQNKKGYAALEDYFINVLGHSKAKARELLTGERVPGIAMTLKSEYRTKDRAEKYTSLGLDQAFSKMGKKGPKWVIDTIAHAGGATLGGSQHSVLTTLNPEKRIKEIINILPKDILKLATSQSYIGQDLANAYGQNHQEIMESTLERLIYQYQKYGKIFPLLGEGRLTPAHVPKGTPGAASGGLITQRGLINQKSISDMYNLPSFATGIDYLPNDMIAQLHQGERVLTKEENKTYSSSAPTTNIININGSDLNKKEIAQAVMVELDRAKNKNNKTNMVGR